MESKQKKITLALLFVSISFLIYFPYTFGRFNADDFFIVTVLEEKIPYSPFAGFWASEFDEFKAFHSLWWYDSEATGKFFRPLPSAIFSISFYLFGRSSAVFLHSLSILLHGIVAFTVFLLFLKLTAFKPIAFVSALIFLFCEDHNLTVGWISTNTDILATLFINLAVLFHIDFRKSGKKSKFLLSNLFQIFALACKETAIVTPAIIILYEFIFQSSSFGEDKLFKRILSKIGSFFSNMNHWILSLTIGLTFLFLYKYFGFGIHKSLMYYDPFEQTTFYLKNVAIGLPIMFTGLLSVFPIGITLFIKETILYTVLMGIFLLILMIVFLFPFRSEKIIQYSFILFLISLLPQLSADVSERQLYYPFVWGSLLLSFLIFQIGAVKRKYLPEEKRGLKYLNSVFGYYLAISLLVLAPLLSIFYSFTYKQSLESIENHIIDCKPLIEKSDAEHIVFLNSPGPFFTFYSNDILRFHFKEWKDSYLLSSFNGEIWAKQISDSSILLKTPNEGWLSNMFSRLIRTRPKLESGDKFYTKLFTATIVKLTQNHDEVLEVRFDFKKSLNNEKLIFLYFDGERFNDWKFDKSNFKVWKYLGNTSDVFRSMM